MLLIILEEGSAPIKVIGYFRSPAPVFQVLLFRVPEVIVVRRLHQVRKKQLVGQIGRPLRNSQPYSRL